MKIPPVEVLLSMEIQPRAGEVLVPGRVLDEARAAVERLLAAQGDRAEPELVRLQHTLSELRIP